MSEQPVKARPAAPVHEGVVHGPSSSFVQEVKVGRHGFIADEPIALGGTDTGPSPYDLLVSALGACTSMTVSSYARRKQWPLEAVTVRVQHAKVPRPGADALKTETIDRFEREVTLHGDLTDEQRARLLEIANRCPVHKTLSAGSVIDTTLV